MRLLAIKINIIFQKGGHSNARTHTSYRLLQKEKITGSYDRSKTPLHQIHKSELQIKASVLPERLSTLGLIQANNLMNSDVGESSSSKTADGQCDTGILEGNNLDISLYNLDEFISHFSNESSALTDSESAELEEADLQAELEVELADTDFNIQAGQDQSFIVSDDENVDVLGSDTIEIVRQ